MKVFIKKTQFGFQHRKEGDTAWTYFPNDVNKTSEGMKEYFQRNTRDPREIIFCNPEGMPAKLYSVKLNETLAGHKFATVDYDKQFLIEPDMFVTDAEKLDFLQNHSSMKMDQEANKLTTDQEKIKYYLSNVDDLTKEQFKAYLNEKLTPDVIKEICVNNAKTYSLPAEVEFISE